MLQLSSQTKEKLGPHLLGQRAKRLDKGRRVGTKNVKLVVIKRIVTRVVGRYQLGRPVRNKAANVQVTKGVTKLETLAVKSKHVRGRGAVVVGSVADALKEVTQKGANSRLVRSLFHSLL